MLVGLRGLLLLCLLALLLLALLLGCALPRLLLQGLHRLLVSLLLGGCHLVALLLVPLLELLALLCHLAHPLCQTIAQRARVTKQLCARLRCLKSLRVVADRPLQLPERGLHFLQGRALQADRVGNFECRS